MAAAAHEATAQAAIRIVTRSISHEVPIHVTPETDVRYPLPWGFVRLHDAAARGLDVSLVPGPAGESDDAPSLVKPSVAAAVIATNYGACRGDAEQLSALQDWVRATASASAGR